MPCGKISIPAPNDFTRFPFESNFRIVSIGLMSLVAGSRQLLPPHRSATQIERPSLSTSTALVDPHVRPAGSLKKLVTVLYGFGTSFTGGIGACISAAIRTSLAANAATAARATTMELLRAFITHASCLLDIPRRRA